MATDECGLLSPVNARGFDGFIKRLWGKVWWTGVGVYVSLTGGRERPDEGRRKLFLQGVARNRVAVENSVKRRETKLTAIGRCVWCGCEDWWVFCVSAASRTISSWARRKRERCVGRAYGGLVRDEL